MIRRRRRGERGSHACSPSYMTTAGPASLPDWPYKSTPALALDEGAHIGTVQLLVSRPTLRTYSAIWPTRGWGTSAQPRTSHGIADHEWRCWPLHKNAMPELAHIGMCGRLEPVAATRQRSRMTSYARYRPASLRTATPLITSRMGIASLVFRPRRAISGGADLPGSVLPHSP